MFPTQGAWVQSLVRELDPTRPEVQAKRKVEYQELSGNSVGLNSYLPRIVDR